MTTLLHRQLGTQGLSVSVIGLGCMSLSGVYGEADEAESVDLIRTAIDNGIDHFDSSDMYGWGHNEGVLGRALQGLRDKVVLATKFGQTQNPEAPMASTAGPIRSARMRGFTQAPWCRGDRPLLPASGRSGRADRGHCRCDGGPRESRQGPLARPVGSTSRHDPAGACRPSDQRGANRILPPIQAGSRGDARGDAAAWHRLRRL